MPDFEKLFPQEMQLRFSAAHSLYVGHKPHQVKCDEGLCENILSNKTEEDIMSFGLFGGSNNMNTFYPGLTAEDWMPKDADFIEPLFRLFSATTVVHMGIPIDFTDEGILKNSMRMLLGQTVNTNHETDVQEAIGAVSRVSWQNSYKVGNKTIPAGINGVLKIDAKSNPRIARGIMMDPPSIHSNSVTLRFNHKKSHDVEDFWEKAGTFDEKGQMYRLIATDIKSYKETSLVHHGADPYAQIIKENGEINNPDYAVRQYDFAADNDHQSFNFNLNTNMEFTNFLASIGLQDSGIENWEGLAAHLTKSPEVAPEVAQMQALLAIQPELTPEGLTALIENQIPENAVILQEGQTVITEAQQATLAAVEAAGDIATLVANAALGVTHLDTIRNNAVATYKVLHGDKAQQAIIDTINNADLKAAKAFEASYAAELEKTLPLTCTKCGSHEVSRASNGKPKSQEEKATGFQADLDFYAKKTRRAPSSFQKKSEE